MTVIWRRPSGAAFSRFFAAAATVAFGVILTAPQPARAQQYLLTDLGTLGGTATFALGLNDRGQIAGTGRTTGSSRPQIAFLSSPGGGGGPLTNLGTLPGSTFSRAFTVNNAGVAVGEAFTAPAQGEGSRAVVFQNGQVFDVFGASSVANDINEMGTVAGQRTTAGGTRAFVFTDANGNNTSQAGETFDLSTLRADGSGTSFGFALNNRGQVAGRASTDTGTSHAFLFTDGNANRAFDAGEMRDMGSLSGASTFSEALGLNDAGQVVGRYALAGTGQSAFLFSGGAMTDLGRLAGFNFARAIDINNRGEIVGTASASEGFSGRALLFRGGAALDLNDRIAPGVGWTLTSAEGINEAGQIVGYGTLNGQTRAVLLTPNAIPEPGTAALVLIAAAAAAALPRKQQQRQYR